MKNNKINKLISESINSENSKKKLTYISLFSSAGVGCYGFKSKGFECIATNELLDKRLEVQKFNSKCKYDSGYIGGDITKIEVQKKIFEEITLWKKNEKIDKVDVVIATPPCQGMSVANHKKNNNEIIRNSLVIESIKFIKVIKPRFFIFENVPAFIKSICNDVDGTDKTICEAIQSNLGNLYSYSSQIINFKDYGSNSSRKRTLVIGVLNELADEISPLEIFPSFQKEKSLYDIIGNLKSLNNMGEIDKEDIYHSFRIYQKHMRDWIIDLKEGQSAFDNKEDIKKPHQIKNGELVINIKKNSDKYQRQYWNKVASCITTRNDSLASQNTIHPNDDRVLSIRELMSLMTIPFEFKWVEKDFEKLNKFSLNEKKNFLKKEELKIRQSIGEAVPTIIFEQMAEKIKKLLSYNSLNLSKINELLVKNDFSNYKDLIIFINKNPMNLSASTLGKIAELSNTSRTNNSAFFTNKTLITEILKDIPDCKKQNIRILEPSVGVGNFIPLILKKFENKNIILDVVDIDLISINILKIILSKYTINNNVKINYINSDFLLHKFKDQYDYIIGNPPFYKIKNNAELLREYRLNAVNKKTTNICSFFLDKSIKIGNYISLILPKSILNTPEFNISRNYLSEKSIEKIIDFGEKGFKGVLIETIAISINNKKNKSNTIVTSYTNNIFLSQKQDYIFDKKFPYWIIYRNKMFDEISNKLDFNVFNVFRDRQIVNKYLSNSGDIRVLKSRNINDIGTKVIDLIGYDSYINKNIAKEMIVNNYINVENLYLTPNMTYKPRMIKKPKGVITNGSLAILTPKEDIIPTKNQLLYFSSKEYRNFYQIARNYQTRSLNVDSASIFFYGLLRDEMKQ